MKKNILLAVCAIALVAAILLVIKGCPIGTGAQDPKGNDTLPKGENVDTLIEDNDTITLQVGKELKKIPILEHSAPEFDDDKGTYSMTISVKQVSDIDKVVYSIMEPFGMKKIIASSESGKFEDIPPSLDEEGTAYLIGAKITKKDGTVEEVEPVSVTGFIKVTKVSHKIDPKTLENLLNSQSQDIHELPELKAPEVKFEVVGLSKDEHPPHTYSDIMNNLTMGIWTSVNILSLGYDENNYVNYVKLRASK